MLISLYAITYFILTLHPSISNKPRKCLLEFDLTKSKHFQFNTFCFLYLKKARLSLAKAIKTFYKAKFDSHFLHKISANGCLFYKWNQNYWLWYIVHLLWLVCVVSRLFFKYIPKGHSVPVYRDYYTSGSLLLNLLNELSELYDARHCRALFYFRQV